MRDIQHLLRVALTFVVVISAFLVVRSLLVPESFGRIGHYRAASVDEAKARPAAYAGQQACASCHKKQTREKAASVHSSVSCESCHGGLEAHTKDPAGTPPAKPPRAEREVRAFCSLCHEENISRPPRFPQVNIFTHNPGIGCSTCHNPHHPKL